VMEVLPGDWSLNILENFLTRAIASNFHECLEGQVVKNLRKSENLQVRAELITLQNRLTVITDRMSVPFLLFFSFFFLVRLLSVKFLLPLVFAINARGLLTNQFSHDIRTGL
jgi:hypothetical protein